MTLFMRPSGHLSQPIRCQNRRNRLADALQAGAAVALQFGAKGIGTSGVETNSGAAFSDGKHSRAGARSSRSPRPCVSPDSCTTSSRPVFSTDSAIGPISSGCKTSGFQTSTEQPDWAAAAKKIGPWRRGRRASGRFLPCSVAAARRRAGRRRNRCRRCGSSRAACARRRGTGWDRRTRPAGPRRFPAAWQDRAVSARGSATTVLRTRRSGTRPPSCRRRRAAARAWAPRNRCGSARCPRSGRVASRPLSRSRRTGTR